ncbi:leucine-rich repeat receptor-like serine/threonine/tyrosine-protein kinase SOBIR1 [Nicotiana tabacum]|uniref:Leucine-rich repeat receptor-like serine/threonine/tyrosine-protein kinase SOBIR1 n=1 Tax=Nicotiana tabacum TaxID=4097 RepID=A0A1S3XP18_TOBAC|nr:PREDICTED: leucine-rich repeat receptor-like serine/threonine/tyrosine-protein kinase SOBIR1 [Nicotiana tabacum]
MAFTASQIHFFFFSLFAFLLIAVQARLNLYPRDHAALLLVQKDLGIQGQRIALRCNSATISCERRKANRTQLLRVTRIDFRSNGLTGTLSPAIGKLSELKELSLPNNQLFDQIPVQILECRKLEVLDLGNNLFSGKVPSELSSLLRLRILDLSSNELSGNLNFLKYFPNLEKLSLADNMFTGKIPPSLKSFRNLRFLNISGNSFLEGPVPAMSQVEHLSADLDRNTFVPKRYILAENSTSSNQISALAPNSNSGNAPAPAPSHSVAPIHKSNNRKKRKVRAWFLGFFAGSFAGAISAVLLSVLFKLVMFFVRKGKTDGTLTIYSPLIKKAEDLAFLEKEDGVASLEMIGKGGCGEVYRAELPGSNGKIIAIKKIIQPPMDAAELTEEDTKALNKKMRQVKSEIQILGQIRHRNLLPLLAHMPRPDCHYLVYEYMKNGSLQDILQQVTEGTRELDWLGRHRIAVGIAAGLEYLHINHSQCIIHRDLKPANVLLDDDMEARIADFGLAKALPDAHTHITTSNVAGTVGYIAPEYHQTLKFTDKCDIYSFGVVLAVLVIGKLPSDEFFQHTPEMSLVKWLRNVMTSEDPKRAIDPKLIGTGFEEQMLLVLKIACFCTLENPKERPNSKDVRCMLTQIKH